MSEKNLTMERVEKIKSLIYASEDLGYTLQKWFRSPTKLEKELLQNYKYTLIHNDYMFGFWIYLLENNKIAIGLRMNERKYYGIVQKVYFYVLK